jgi:pimeloyl-ACP methyl ester carboxylesterase
MHLVLVHGAGGTPGTWLNLAPVLRADGFDVTLVTNSMESLRGDIANTTAAVDAADGPVLLVGHSYGGAVITGAGDHERVTGLVYLAAFGPDEGETVNGIVERYDPAPISGYMTAGPRVSGKAITVVTSGMTSAGIWIRPCARDGTRRPGRRPTSSTLSRPGSPPGAGCPAGTWWRPAIAPWCQRRSVTWRPG